MHARLPFIDHNGILRIQRSGIPVIVVPSSMRDEFVSKVHGGIDNNHAKVNATLFALAQFAWWPTMEADVKKQVSNCLVCQAFRRVPLNSEMGKPEQRLPRMDTWHMDLCPMPTATSGENGVWVTKDAATGWTFLMSTHDKSSASAIRAIERCLAVNTTYRSVRRGNRRRERRDGGVRSDERHHGGLRLTTQPKQQRRRRKRRRSSEGRDSENHTAERDRAMASVRRQRSSINQQHLLAGSRRNASDVDDGRVERRVCAAVRHATRRYDSGDETAEFTLQ